MSKVTCSVLVALAMSVFAPVPGSAAYVTYVYTGNPYDFFLTAEVDAGMAAVHFGDRDNPYLSAEQQFLTAEFVIDRDLAGGSLANLSYHSSPCWADDVVLCDGDAMVSFHYFDGVERLTIDRVRGVHAFFVVSFRTNRFGDLIDWSFNVGDGPPDHIFDVSGDCVFSIGACSASARGPGTWTQVPATMTLPLLLGGMLGRLLLRRR